jgi:cytoskeleton protein RodZ
MNTDAGRTAGDLEPAAPPSKTPGELLREERIRRKLSVQQAAEDLHLDVRSVEALESNNFQALGAPVYAKGHLRKYALLLGLGPEFIIQRYLAVTGVPELPLPIPAAVAMQPRRRRTIRVPWRLVFGAFGAVVVGLGAWAVVRWYLDSQAPVAEAIAAPPIVVEPVEPPRPPVQAAQVTVQLTFASASWTEVNDADGLRLMYEVGQEGQTRTLAGKAPLRVVLGLASAVKMRINDQPATIPRQTGKDATRFEIAADGSMR